MLKGFRAFLLRGNVVDLAVAVVIGAAFGSVVTAFVIASAGGKPDFSGLYFTVNGSRFLYGEFLNALLAFLLIAAVIFYFVVLPINSLVARSRKEPPPDPTAKKCGQCLSEIPVDATRCAFCTQPV